MTNELYNRIHDELKEFLNREPTINEIYNSQNDYIMMARVKERVYNEDKGLLEDRVNILETKVSKINDEVKTLIK